MVFLFYYFFIGVLFSICMALMQARMSPRKGIAGHLSQSDLIGAYVMIALAWPVAACAFTFKIVSYLFQTDEKTAIHR